MDMASENARSDQPRHGKRGAPQAFARKLAEILRDEPPECISWNEAGNAFMVRDTERFSQDVLVKHYRHSKFSSFQRQLNLYQFRKIVKGADAGGYQHPMFHRDRPEDLCHVRRSVSGAGRCDASGETKGVTKKRNAAAAAAAVAGRTAVLNQEMNGGGGAIDKRVHKSGAAARRVGKLGNRALMAKPRTMSSFTYSDGVMMGDHAHQKTVVALQGQDDAAAGAVGVFPNPTDVISSDAGIRSPWTSGESSDSDASVDSASAPAAAADKFSAQNGAGGKEPKTRQARRPRAESSDDEGGVADGGQVSDGGDDSGDDAERDAFFRREARGASDVGGGEPRRQHQLERTFSCASLTDHGAGGDAAARLNRERDGEGAHRHGGGAATSGGGGGQSAAAAAAAGTATRKSPFNFFKKTFSFIERAGNHSRGVSASSAGTAGAAAVAEPTATSTERISPSSSDDNGSGGSGGSSPDSEFLMVDTSAAARAAAAGEGVHGARPPPVTVTGGVHRIPLDPVAAAAAGGNKSPLTPKSSIEAAAAAAAMPPPPRREQREELGLVEQLTNMVEVFDICDLLRKVSTSGSSRLDKHGAIVKSNQPQHIRNMSVDTDSGLPQSPIQGRHGHGQSPTGLGSLASMELVRDSSKDWDALMAGSADVSDLGNTMVQSVAEFFSF